MMLYLTCELKVKGLNVLQYASKKGATRLLDEILRTPYVFINPVTEQFDVTYLIPDSVPEPRAPHGCRRAAALPKPLSCIELIVNNRSVASQQHSSQWRRQDLVTGRAGYTPSGAPIQKKNLGPLIYEYPVLPSPDTVRADTHSSHHRHFVEDPCCNAHSYCSSS